MKLGILIWGAVICVLCAACAALQSPAIAPDIAKELACIQTHAEGGETDPVAIGLACGGVEAQLVVDFLAALLGGSWASAHPTLAPPLRGSITSFRMTHGGHS